jgi:hypothetical protein
MFFRRTQPKLLTYDERLDRVRQAGFTVEAVGGPRQVRVSRNGCAVVLESANGEPRAVERAGLVMHGEIGALVDGGYQKFFLTPGGKRKPALASQLRALHDFEEDLKEALGQISLYNEALGTVSTFYLYDRIRGRDRGVPKRPWE